LVIVTAAVFDASKTRQKNTELDAKNTELDAAKHSAEQETQRAQAAAAREEQIRTILMRTYTDESTDDDPLGLFGNFLIFARTVGVRERMAAALEKALPKEADGLPLEPESSAVIEEACGTAYRMDFLHDKAEMHLKKAVELR